MLHTELEPTKDHSVSGEQDLTKAGREGTLVKIYENLPSRCSRKDGWLEMHLFPIGNTEIHLQKVGFSIAMLVYQRVSLVACDETSQLHQEMSTKHAQDRDFFLGQILVAVLSLLILQKIYRNRNNRFQNIFFLENLWLF